MRTRSTFVSLLGIAVLASLGAAAFSLSGCRTASAVRQLDASLEPATRRPLTLVTRFAHGSLTVSGAADNRWHLQASVTVWAYDQETADAIAADLDVIAREEGDRFVVKILPVSGRWGEDDYRLAIRSVFRVPRATPLDVVTTHGALVIEDLDADVRGRTTHGAIVVRRVAGAVDCRSSHGIIQAERLSGGTHRFVSTHGGATLRDIDGPIELSTTHGAIEADLGIVRRGASRLATTHGSITCRVAPSSDVAIVARTTHGRIRCTIPGASRELDGNSGEVRVGGGRGQLAIRTTHGRVTLAPSELESVRPR